MNSSPNEPLSISTNAPASAPANVPAISGKTTAAAYDHSIVRRFFWATLTWFLVSTAIGVYAIFLTLAPETGTNPDAAYGRIKPLHLNVTSFGLFANAAFTFIYYSLPSLCGRPMHSRAVSRLHFWSWQMLVAAGAIMVPMGLDGLPAGASRWQWPIELGFAFSWTALFGLHVAKTIAERRIKIAYVSIWFSLASIIVVSMVLCFGVIRQLGLDQSAGLTAGVGDAAWMSFHHNQLMTFMVIAPLMGAMYYFVPKMVERPLANYPLAIVHFWTFCLVALWIGPRDLHYTVMPQWVTSAGMLAGILFLMPSLAGIAVGWQTIASGTGRLRNQAAVRFVTVGLVFYFVAIVLSTLQSFKSIDAIVHYTSWVDGTDSLWAMGFGSMMVIGIFYWLIPKIFQSPMPFPILASAHLYLATAATLMMVMGFLIAGGVESRYLMSLDEIGNLANPEFQGVLAKTVDLRWCSVLGGVLYAAGLVLMVVNAVGAWAGRPAVYQKFRETSDSVSLKSEQGDAPERNGILSPVVQSEDLAGGPAFDDVPVLDLARRLDQWRRLGWHERYERFPSRMALPIVATVLLAAVVLVLPSMSIARGDMISVSDAGLTPLEQIGRDIYRREGCVSCHSQTVRPLVAETKRYGAPSERLDFAGDQPVLWGRRRIGPDLARQGGANTSLWHWNHLTDPRSINEKSVMPSFEHLRRSGFSDGSGKGAAIVDGDPSAEKIDPDWPDQLIDFQSQLVAADIVSMGGPISTDGVMTFNSEAVALIAYLQRLGNPPMVVPKSETVDPASQSDPMSQSDLASQSSHSPFSSMTDSLVGIPSP